MISCKSHSIVAIPSMSIPFTYISEIKTVNDLHTMDIYVNKEISIQFFYGVEFKNITHYIDRNERVNVIKSVLKPLNGYTDEEILHKNTNNEISFPCLTQVPYSRTIHKDILNTYMYNNSTYGSTLLPLICYVKEIKNSSEGEEEREDYYQEIDKFDESFIIFDYKDNSNIQVLSYIILTKNRVFIMKDIFDEGGDGEMSNNDNSNSKNNIKKSSTTTNTTKNTSKTTNTSRGSRNQRRNRSRSHLFSESQSSSLRNILGNNNNNNNNNRISQREIGTVEVIPLGVVNEEKTESNNNNNNNSLGRMLNTRDVFNINVTDPVCNSHSTSPLLTNSTSVIETNGDKIPIEGNVTNIENITETKTENRSSKMNNDEKENQICIICLTNKVNTIFVGCRHKIICDECIKEVDKCPICRSVNEAYLVIWYINLLIWFEKWVFMIIN